MLVYYHLTDTTTIASVLGRRPPPQVLFWHQAEANFITFSVDARAKRVYSASYKQFSRGWLFYRLTVSADQERRMYTFLADQCRLRAPFNTAGALLVYIRPVDTADNAWFCSQLVVAALQAAGFCTHLAAYALGPAEVKRYLEQADEFSQRVAEADNPRRTKSLLDHARAFE